MGTNVGVKMSVAAAVAAGGTFDVAYPTGYVQSNFDPSGTVSMSLQGGDYSGLAVTFGASAATVTWPANAAGSIPANTEFYVGLPINGPASRDAATYQADSTATTVAGLVTDFNALLAKLRESGQMQSS